MFRVCPHPARPEENGVEVTPVDRGSDRGRRPRGGRGEPTVFETWSVRPALQWMLLTSFCECDAVSGGRGRGRAPAGSRFSAQGMGYGGNTHTDIHWGYSTLRYE